MEMPLPRTTARGNSDEVRTEDAVQTEDLVLQGTHRGQHSQSLAASVLEKLTMTVWTYIET
eukprot:SAG31_NODE_3735_length_3938_cov_1.264913_5_plen_61_part_00